MSRKPRHLSPEEERLWKTIAETTVPIERQKPSFPIKNQKVAKKDLEQTVFRPQNFRVGEKAQTETAIPVRKTPIQMDRKAYTKLRRGKSRPDARIDLHGMTAETAHTALTAFLLRAHADEKRLVLVITGKGRVTEEGRMGVLKRQVPHWLESPPLRQIVLQTAEAHQRHGGSGALYVYLRR